MLDSKDTETGPGVYETALAYTSALKMADNAILFKYAAKSIGMKHGIIPSFMAKPWGNVSTRWWLDILCNLTILLLSSLVVAGLFTMPSS